MWPRHWRSLFPGPVTQEGPCYPTGSLGHEPCAAEFSQSVSTTFLKNKSPYFVHKRQGMQHSPDDLTSVSYVSQPGHQGVNWGTYTKATSQRSVHTTPVANRTQRDYWTLDPVVCSQRLASFLTRKFTNIVLKTRATLTGFDHVKHWACLWSLG